MTTTEISPGGPARGSRRMTPSSAHDEAVVQAEARYLARALAPYRVLHKSALERAAHAGRWHDGGFDRALTAAIRAGSIRRLPAGFYARCDGRRAIAGT